jgi:hypothetical protein
LNGTTTGGCAGKKICRQSQFEHIAIEVPAKWPGMQTTFNQVTLSKDKRDKVSIIGDKSA